MLIPWLRNLFRRSTLDHDMRDEMATHISLRADTLVQSGLSRDEAERRARLEFGNMTATQESAREAWSWTALEQILQDLRYAARGLRRSPLFTAIAVLSLGIGIGTNTAVFGLVYSVLLARLPLPQPTTLASPVKQTPRLTSPGFSFAEYRALSKTPGLTPERTTALFGMFSAPVEVGASREDMAVDFVDGNYFRVLGLSVEKGRAVGEDDERRGDPVVVISDGVWRAQFNRADDVVGRSMKILGTAFTVIGVTPPAYHGIAAAEQHDLIAPLSTTPLIGLPNIETVGRPALLVVTRLTDAAARDHVGAAMDALYQRCCAAGQLLSSKGAPSPPKIVLRDLSHGYVNPKFDYRAMFGRMLLVLMGAVAGVLLIVCANVGSLLLGRAAARRRELAVRLSLGASRARLARQLIAESLLLALLGAALGLWLAAAGTRALSHNLPGFLASLSDVIAFHLDGTMLGFTGGASVLGVLLFGTLPAWRATRTDLVSSLKDGSMGNARTPVGLLDRGVIVMQVAMTLALVAASALLAATLRNLQHIDPEFTTTNVVTAWLDTRQTPLASRGLGPVTDDVLQRMRSIPGVRSAPMALSAPQVSGRRSLTQLGVLGYQPQTGEDMQNETNEVTPDYFAATGIPLRQGRAFTSGDLGGATALVNESFARQYFAGRSALGGTILFGGESGRAITIVGVVSDARYADLRSPPPPMVYRPTSQMGMEEVGTLVVRIAPGTDERALAPTMRAGILGAAPGVQIRNITTIEEAMTQALARERFAAMLGVVFGLIALILAVIGLYGVVAYTVSRRTSEIGVRMALGAQRSDVVWQVFRTSLGVVAIGVAIGLPLSFLTGRAMASQLWGIGAYDPLLLAGSVLLLVGAATVASIVPALRAARIDPLLALRAD